MRAISIFRGALTVGGWTLASRVIGFLREIMILALIGPGPVMDAFVAAFRLPNMFRRFFAEGAFNTAFVPLFSKKLETGEQAAEFAQKAFNALALTLLGLTGLAMLFMPALVWATAEGFSGDERFAMTTEFGRIVFPYIFFISLAALFSGVLNAAGYFAIAAAAPVFLNVLVCVAMGAAWFIGGNVVTALIWSIPLAGIVQLALVWRASNKIGVRIRPRLPVFDAEMKQLARIALPAALAGGVLQINLVVGQIVASQYQSAVGWLYAADRLYQLPLGIVGIGLGIVLLPDLSRKFAAADHVGAQNALSRAGEIAIALTLPAAIVLCMVPLPVVSVLFERGATGPEDSTAIAAALMIYGLGLPAFVFQKLLQPLYFARSDTRTPFRYALYAMILNAGIAIGAAPWVGWLAPAWAASLSGWAMVALLWLGRKNMGDAASFDARFLTRAPRFGLSALGMGLVLWTTYKMTAELFTQDGLRYAMLAALLMLGALVFFGLCHVTGALRLSELKAGLRRSHS